ncbi:Zinc finger MYND domain-containing 10 isoform B [Micractinium conductrix]|uniref:Zinc finger MYND domain-containing 10 isoform B n=1 Tax=Micractinium conductrix TaxID=554055 RepID=A0A2P6V5T8_9CHLO|nr:Zinc finger MYND domain-containing 10 isoform B [Micractinium conductrix]|eukprot:PSC69454.1 Zinc finger MYND domain-containing 10 isoform B [Micractinium conductrix]
MDSLLARGRAEAAAAAGPTQAALTAPEAERLVHRLRNFDISEVGSPAWLEQHDAVEQLNLQAHLNAQAHADEYVKEALLSADRLTLLARELLLAEVWRERLLPLLERHLAERCDSVTAYQLAYHEAALANLLEVLLYHQDACEAVAEEALVELADWCARCVDYLASPEARRAAAWRERSVQERVAQPPLEELRERCGEVRFGAALCGLTILRYLTDHAPKLSLSVLTRIVTTNDTAMALLPLLEHKPWQRRGRGGAPEVFQGGAWQAVEPADRHRVTQHDGQVWLALHSLLADGEARSKMDLSEGRCEALLRMKRHFNELLLDQLPVLRNLQRVIDELAFGVNTAQGVGSAPTRLIVEQVPTIRAGLLHRSQAEWRDLAEAAMAGQLGAEAQRLSQQRLEKMLRSFELMCGMEGQEEAVRREANALPISVKVDAYRQAKPGVWEWWSTYTLHLNTDKEPEAVSSGSSSSASAAAARCGSGSDGGAAAAQQPNENKPRQPSGDGAAAAAAAGGGKAVRGKRYRLAPLLESMQRPLPSDGKICVLFGGHMCEAQLSLPASETRDASALAPAVWLTVGSLAGPGLALQLRLKRQDRPSERDRNAGVWLPYVPVGGALAVRDGLLSDGS